MRSIRLVVVASVILTSLCLAGTALAQGTDEQPPDRVRGEIIRDDQPEVQPGVLPGVQPGAEEDVAPGVLPVTGADLAAFVAVGLLVIAAGMFIVRRGRASRT